MANNAIPRDFLKNVLQNGMGRYVCQLQRITFRFCKSHPGSRHMRDFIENHLLDFTQKNPGVVVYLQPRRHRPPSIVAEFLNGRRESMEMMRKEPQEICKWAEYMRGRSGVQIVNMIHNNHTETPSTQGIWHPFMFRDSETAVAKFPDPKYSAVRETGKTATDYVLEEFNNKE
ncbi:39S ribosomal protein l43, mitochondrial-like [Plakobranchus ocellatus]|uniref:Large ribosomal subunit protein mL43 n=1 Tax=Plakobranchus ocellatus TaxID=259542 RepID=A0AAV3Y058_9GAST|nr:39S ribosomal protein l43, mitochondrial-like [Plakobranchus ocellatus]